MYRSLHLVLLQITHKVNGKPFPIPTHSQIGSGSSSPPSYVKEGIARCIVEVVKKVWPQLWPSFIQDLCAIGNQVNTSPTSSQSLFIFTSMCVSPSSLFLFLLKPSHMELVLLVYRRLMEDITSYDSQLSSHRKSDMLSEMKNEPSLTPLFHILVTVLEVHMCMYIQIYVQLHTCIIANAL